MSANAENIKSLINQSVRNYPLAAFQNMVLNRILLLITDLADAASGGSGNGSVLVPVTSANFTNATDCPLTTLAGQSIAVYFNENQKFIQKDASEWHDLPGGGFSIDIPNFDATEATYHFYVFVL